MQSGVFKLVLVNPTATLISYIEFCSSFGQHWFFEEGRLTVMEADYLPQKFAQISPDFNTQAKIKSHPSSLYFVSMLWKDTANIHLVGDS